MLRLVRFLALGLAIGLMLPQQSAAQTPRAEIQSAAPHIDGDVSVAERRLRRPDDRRELLAQFGLRPTLVLRLDGWHDDRWPDLAGQLIAVADQLAGQLEERGIETILFLPHQPKADYRGEIAFHEMHPIKHMQHLYLPTKVSFMARMPSSSIWGSMLDLGGGELKIRWALLESPAEIGAWGPDIKDADLQRRLAEIELPACAEHQFTKRAFTALADFRLKECERLVKGLDKKEADVDDESRAVLGELKDLVEATQVRLREGAVENEWGELPEFEKAAALRALARGPLKGTKIGRSWDAEGRRLERSAGYRGQAKAGAAILALRKQHADLRAEITEIQTRNWDAELLQAAWRRGHDRLRKGLADFLDAHGDSPWAAEARQGLAMMESDSTADAGGEKPCGCVGPCDCD